jgi:hypothetical protein
MIDEWSIHYPDIARREYIFTPDIKDSYLRSAVGWVAGLQARLGVELDKAGAASLGDMLLFLEEQEYTVDDIQRKADAKWRVYSKLAGGGSGV